jgi:5-(carboxyamino)imidazole ribonucleotide mutase
MAKIRVAVLMGSDSDLSVVKEALTVFEQFHVAFDVQVLSAHRTPEDTVSYVKKMADQGVDVFVAAAGGAAHLPGVVAAYTIKPVIGIPIQTKTLQGIDSLYSIVQMPPGVPVATVGINAAKNAAILAIQILAASDDSLQKALISYKTDLARGVQEKNTALSGMGWKKYGN